MTYLSKYKRAVIIGCYRNGATLEQISVVHNVPYEKVKVIIETYFKIKID
tara:strand:+ start:18 stop:167 length:150 start_codon:yes stop_codon:yes gene_type:complete